MSRHPASIASLAPIALKRIFDSGRPCILLDVREPAERAICSIPAPPSATELFIPLRELPENLAAIDSAHPDAAPPLVVYCHHGVRSLIAARWLAAHGHQNLFNLDGGIDAYAAEADPTIARY